MKKALYVCFLVLLPLQTSCLSVRLDLRDIEHPVVLNDNPFLGGRPAYVTLQQVDSLSAEIDDSWSGIIIPLSGGTAAGVPLSDDLASLRPDPALAEASARIGGHKDRALVQVSIAASAFAVNYGLLVGQSVSLDVEGSVVACTASDGAHGHAVAP
ncbi:MAG: hypothetical protein ACYS8L_08355 [Planctomycetota bacterium]|jgi:hypothetical protein